MIAFSARRLGLALVFALLSAAAALAGLSDAEARRDAQHRINISGRQRMLSQRIAKAACFAALNPGSTDHIQEMKEAHALFMASTQALKTGSAEMGLAAEREADVLSVIGTASELAQQYSAAIDDYAAAYPAGAFREKLEKVYGLNLPLLLAVNDAADLLESKHEDGHLIRPGLANALNVSGRQRMLSQKMSKELCMIASGYRPQETRAHMLGTIAIFSSSHEELKRSVAQMKLDGKDAGAILDQLAQIERRWQDLRKIFSRVSEGGTPSSEDVKIIAGENRTFLAELSRAVELYETNDTAGTPAQ